MPVNDTAKNVLGTIGSSFLPPTFPSFLPRSRSRSRLTVSATATANRNNMLDRASSPAGVQVLARKVDGGSIPLAHVSVLLYYPSRSSA